MDLPWKVGLNERRWEAEWNRAHSLSSVCLSLSLPLFWYESRSGPDDLSASLWRIQGKSSGTLSKSICARGVRLGRTAGRQCGGGGGGEDGGGGGGGVATVSKKSKKKKNGGKNVESQEDSPRRLSALSLAYRILRAKFLFICSF